MHIIRLFGGGPRQSPRHFRGLAWVLPRATVEYRGFPRQGPRLMALSRPMPRLWPGNVPRLCSWQTPWYQACQPADVPCNYHCNFRGRQTTAMSTAVRGHPRLLPRQSSDTRQLPRKAAAIATAISADVKLQQFQRPSAVLLRYNAIATKIHDNCHSNFHGIPRPSPAIELLR